MLQSEQKCPTWSRSSLDAQSVSKSLLYGSSLIIVGMRAWMVRRDEPTGTGLSDCEPNKLYLIAGFFMERKSRHV